jgi:hypothetical protein
LAWRYLPFIFRRIAMMAGGRNIMVSGLRFRAHRLFSLSHN